MYSYFYPKYGKSQNFIAKIFSDSLTYVKIKRAKIHNSDNAIQDCLSENYFNAKNYCTKYFRHEIFAIYGS